MIQDDLIVKLGQSQQKVMSLTVQVRELKKRAKAAEERVEILEELLMDVVDDLHKVVSASKIDQRIGDVMKKLDEEQPDD
jgi:hypothetical protein